MTQETRQIIDFLFASLENKDQTIQQQAQKIAELDSQLKKQKNSNVAEMAAAANS